MFWTNASKKFDIVPRQAIPMNMITESQYGFGTTFFSWVLHLAMKYSIFYSFRHGLIIDNDHIDIDECVVCLFMCRIWNVDGVVARQVCILWAFFMYIGQATKDVLGIPRPRTPPVLKLEKR
jgi:hypothetical protein